MNKFLFHLFFLIGIGLSGVSAQEPTLLTPDNPVAGTIEKSERKLYRVRLEPGEFAHIEVQQNLIFVHPVIFSEKGEKLFEVRRPFDYLDIKRFTLAADSVPREFTIELTGDRRDANGNGFGIRIARRGSIDDDVRLRIEAERSLFGIPPFVTDFSDKEIVIRKLEKIIDSARKLDDWRFEVLARIALADYYAVMFRNSAAIPHYDRSKELCRANGFRKCEAAAVAGLSASYLFLNDYGKALEYSELAVKAYEELKNPWGQMAVFNRISQLKYRLGQYEQAKEAATRSIEVYGIVTPRPLIALGDANYALGQYRDALQSYQRALDEMSVDADKINYNRTVWRIGEVSAALGDFEGAARYFEDVVAREEKEARSWSRNGALTGLGIIHYKLGDPAKSERYFADSIVANLESEDRLGEALSRYWLARVKYERGELQSAVDEIGKAVEISENLRSTISVDEFKTSYTAKISDYYDLQIEILNRLRKERPDAGFDVQAFHASERSRARTFLDLIKNASVDPRKSVSPALIEEERVLQQRINEAALAKESLSRRSGNRRDVASVETELRDLIAKLDAVRSKIRRQNPRYASLTQTSSTVSLKEIQAELLDRDTVLVEYKIGRERSYVWTVSSSSFEMRELEKGSEIEARAAAAYAMLSARRASPGSEITARLEELSELIIKPIENDLSKKRVVVVADGALQYIPFSALRRGGRYLADESEVLSIPSVAFLSDLRKKSSPKPGRKGLVAIMADPVYDRADSRFALVRNASYSPNGFSRLLFSRMEAKAIASIVPQNDVLLALDFRARKRTVLDETLSAFRIVHFATHGVLDSVHPELSGLALSTYDEKGNFQDGFLRLHEIYNLKLPADLVVLSGCRTGLGKEVRGEGLIGLTRGFMYAGAARVAASLWQVDDSATAELMKHFYYGLVVEKQLPAEALRRAQLRMRSQKRFEDPYFWASFVIQGDWRDIDGN